MPYSPNSEGEWHAYRMDLTILIPIAAFVVVALVVRRYSRWKDSSLSSEEKQAEARLWSNRHGGR